jgi:hypothetical protein
MTFIDPGTFHHLLLLVHPRQSRCLLSHSLDKQPSKAAANVCKAHQLIILLLAPRRGDLSRLTAALWVVG